MARHAQFSFLARKRDAQADRAVLTAIFEWAIEEFSRAAKDTDRTARLRNFPEAYNSVMHRLWKLYQKTDDTQLVEAYETVRLSARVNLPVPLGLAGIASAGKRRRRDANEKLLLARSVAATLKPRSPYKLILDYLNDKGFRRSANAIPMRVTKLQKELARNQRQPLAVIREQLEAFKLEEFYKKYPRKLIELRATSLPGWSAFTSLTPEEEGLAIELCKKSSLHCVRKGAQRR